VGKASTGCACLLPSSKKPRAGQGDSCGSVAESAHPGGGATTESLSPSDEGGKAYSCARSYSAAKYADAVVLVRDRATAALRRVVVVAFGKPSDLACSTCSISAVLRFRRACGRCAGTATAAGTEGGTSVDRSAGARSRITLGECTLPVGILIGAGVERFRGTWPVAGLGGTGGGGVGGRGSSGSSGIDIGNNGAGELVDLLEALRRSMREAEGEMSSTSSAAYWGWRTGLSWKERSSEICAASVGKRARHVKFLDRTHAM